MEKPKLLDRNSFIVEVEVAARKINTNVVSDNELLRYVTEEVVDRVSLYLNYDDEDDYSPRLVKIVARVVISVFNQTKTNANSTEPETGIKSISDNGQSITFDDKTKNYLATVEDGELFGGITPLLKPYRRIRAISR